MAKIKRATLHKCPKHTMRQKMEGGGGGKRERGGGRERETETIIISTAQPTAGVTHRRQVLLPNPTGQHYRPRCASGLGGS